MSAIPGAGRIREAGDSALLFDLGATEASALQGSIDESVNARAIAVAADIRARAIPGVRDVVSTFHTVAVYFDLLAADVAAIAGLLHRAGDSSAGQQQGRLVEVPVTYGGEAGPDLAGVAAFGGCSPEEVITRHAARTYRVFMLGFLPGFAYMASVDERIAAPRRASPRLRVPAGSVGIAGPQTAVYPLESPGGWQIIGRTPLEVFNAERTPAAAIFSPGDRVRFVPMPSGTVGAGLSRPYEKVRLKADPTWVDRERRHVTVVRPGLLTTVQDTGRWGHQASGVPVSGAMDPVAHRVANAIVGNGREAATLEATLVGPELRMEQETTIAIAGADLGAALDGSVVPLHAPVRCRGGSVLRFGERRAGARAYIAFDGGIAVPPVLGSRSTHVLSAMGGINGRALRAGDSIPLGDAVGPSRHTTHVGTDLQIGPTNAGGARLRIRPGPQAEFFGPETFDLLQQNRFVVSTQSDRMGYRLTGGPPLPRHAATEMISDATFCGGVQVPPSGAPILLMADRQTSGGYPQIAVVITADLPKAAQLVPGDWLELQFCTRAEAVAALIAQEGKLLAVR